MFIRWSKYAVFVFLAAGLPCASLFAQDFSGLKDLAQWAGQPDAVEPVAQEMKQVKDKIVSENQHPHLFEIFTFDSPKGPQHLLQIREDQLGELFLLSGALERGTGEKDLFSSQMLNTIDGFAWYFEKSNDGRKIYFVRKNTGYATDSDSPMQKTIERSFGDSVMGTLKNACVDPPADAAPHAEDATKDSKALFRGCESAADASSPPMPTIADVTKAACTEPEGAKNKVFAIVLEDVSFDYLFDLKRLMKGYSDVKTKETTIEKIKVYPWNVEVEVRMNFSSEASGGSPSALADPRGFALQLHYSLSSLPDSAGFTPRPADERVGYFDKGHQDWSKTGESLPTPDVYWINRWNLQKVDPRAAVSEVKNPIVYYLENTIPHEYREAVRAGILAWNDAFARVGLLNAIIVKEQDQLAPEEQADFDPADVRFNVVRWFLGKPGDLKYTAIGPFQYNPLNGQIYHAMISVSAWIARAAANKADLVSAGASRPGQPGAFFCDYGEQSIAEAAFGVAALESAGRITPEEKKKLLSELITHILIHEVGHTLGLRHNFKASTVYSWNQIHDPENQGDYTASNMSYAPVHIPSPGVAQPFYQTHLGKGDYWAIEYGYKNLGGASPEEAHRQLNAIAARSGTDPELAYGEDVDKIVGIDPQVTAMVESRDLIKYGQERVGLVKQLWKNLETQTPTTEEGYQKNRRIFVQSLDGEYSNAVDSVLKLVGGIYTSRSRPGDGGGPAFQPVPRSTQEQALDFLARELFSDRAFPISGRLLQNLAAERLGDLHHNAAALIALPVPVDDLILNIQNNALGEIYGLLDEMMTGRPSVVKRLVQSQRLVSDPKQAMTVSELFGRVRKSIWSEIESPRPGGKIYDISPLRRRLQTKHIEHLGRCLNPEDPIVQDAGVSARRDLLKISSEINAALLESKRDAGTRDYLRLMDAKIKKLLKGPGESADKPAMMMLMSSGHS